MSVLRLSGVIVDYSNDGWVEFKKWLDGTYAHLRYVWVDEGAAYNIAALDDQVYRTCGINKADAADFEANYKKNIPVGSQTADGKTIVSVWPTEGVRKTIVTHSWSNKTTWYQKAVEVIDEVPVATNPGVLYTLARQNVIDTYHGKLWDEDNLGRRVRVVVDGVVMAEKDPFNGAGDYFVDYGAGTIKFDPAILAGANVVVTYHYATTSEFVVAPAAGKVLKIRNVETQFSQDVVLNDTVDFTAYGLVDVFAPQLMPGVPSGTKIPLSSTRYKTMYDFQAESNGALPVIPPIGGPSWRGIQQPIVVFPWNYAALTNLSSAAGMEIRIRLMHDTPFGGEFATATLYCLSEAE
jgi:hypothetical protein